MIQFNDLTSKSFLKDLTEKEALNILGGFIVGPGPLPSPEPGPPDISDVKRRADNARASYKQDYLSILQQFAKLGKDIENSVK